MSQETPGYNIDSSVAPASLDAFRNRACALPLADPNYQRPTPEELSALIKIMGWSQNDVAELVGVNYDPKRGSSTVRRWKAPVEKPDHRDIPNAAWRLLLLHSGIVGI